MKKIILILIFVSNVFSYEIGGAYATLVDCSYGQFGYQYGNIGTYKVNGKFYQVFFGTNYCQY